MARCIRFLVEAINCLTSPGLITVGKAFGRRERDLPVEIRTLSVFTNRKPEQLSVPGWPWLRDLGPERDGPDIVRDASDRRRMSPGESTFAA
jgi:hypothetical protein